MGLFLTSLLYSIGLFLYHYHLDSLTGVNISRIRSQFCSSKLLHLLLTLFISTRGTGELCKNSGLNLILIVLNLQVF